MQSFRNRSLNGPRGRDNAFFVVTLKRRGAPTIQKSRGSLFVESTLHPRGMPLGVSQYVVGLGTSG